MKKEKEVLVLIVQLVAGEELEESFITSIKYDENDEAVEKSEKVKIKDEIMKNESVYQVYFEDK